MITIERIKKEADHLDRLKKAGVKREPILGSVDILWIRYDGGREEWELLPRWLGELALGDFHNFEGVRRACLYRVPPRTAPMWVVGLWLSGNHHLAAA